MQVEVVMAWPRRFLSASVTLPDGACVADAIGAVRDLGGFAPALAQADGYALHGVRAQPTTLLQEGDRVELLRPLQLDPKEARRRRAARRR